MTSKILKTIHEAAQGLVAAGVMEKKTMRKFDALCLPPVKQFSKEKIRKLRQREKVSQAVFASYLNITPSTIQSWEQGEKKPSGPALKLLNMVEKNGLGCLALE